MFQFYDFKGILFKINTVEGTTWKYTDNCWVKVKEKNA
jgi:hypothetical protein